MDRLARDLEIDAGVPGQRQAQLAAPLERARGQQSPHFGEQRAQCRLGRGWWMVGPQRVDQLVAADQAQAVRGEIRHQEAALTAGQLAGMSRASALEFSFFLSIPTMVAATCYDLLKSLRGKGENPIGVTEIDAHGWIVLGIGFVISFIVAYGTVAWFMAWVRRRGFAPFAVYRIMVGIFVLIYASRLAKKARNH